MSRIKAYVALVTLLAAAGCASGPEVADEAPTAATPVAATPVAATPVAATEESGIVPVTVLDVNQLIATQAPHVICREVLKQGSNVHVTQCLTADLWKRYERQEAQEAARTVRMMQGNPYR
jgi:hypothetical protein